MGKYYFYLQLNVQDNKKLQKVKSSEVLVTLFSEQAKNMFREVKSLWQFSNTDFIQSDNRSAIVLLYCVKGNKLMIWEYCERNNFNIANPNIGALTSLQANLLSSHRSLVYRVETIALGDQPCDRGENVTLFLFNDCLEVGIDTNTHSL